jgi:tyrosyl-DNA phosphodiesterase-1
MERSPAALDSMSTLSPVGSGARFRFDLMSYLQHYGSRLNALTGQLRKYDYESIRAALIASVPGRQNLRSTDPEQETLFGWPGLKNVLRSVPANSNRKPHIVMQVSSVASLGAGDTWLRETFQETLCITKKKTGHLISPSNPNFSLIFPTADSIRRSVDGYASGGSIHMKRTTPQAAKQLDYLHPMLCHWAYDAGSGASSVGDSVSNPFDLSETVQPPVREAGRKRAAPHIKTYIRFTDESLTEIDWALMTSANLSTQAWGAKTNAAHEVRVCSYEIGVVVWPGLWGKDLKMVPVFGTDLPEAAEADGIFEKSRNARPGPEKTDADGGEVEREPNSKIGLRMPYDLPLMPYKEEDMPWCASLPDDKVDWMGRAWPGFEGR